MIARISPTFPQIAAAIFPVPGCTVRGYSCANGTRYNLTLITHREGLPAQYLATGATCYEALAKAVQLFNDSAHSYPAAGPLAAAGSYSPPQEPQPFPRDDEPATLDDTDSRDDDEVDTEAGPAIYEPTPAWAPEGYYDD